MKSNGIDKGQFVTNTAGKLTEKYKIFKEVIILLFSLVVAFLGWSFSLGRNCPTTKILKPSREWRKEEAST